MIVNFNDDYYLIRRNQKKNDPDRGSDHEFARLVAALIVLALIAAGISQGGVAAILTIVLVIAGILSIIIYVHVTD